MLVKRSSTDEGLALSVGSRRDLPRQHFLRLLEQASAAVRVRLAAENPEAGDAVQGVLSEVVGGIRSEARKQSAGYAMARTAVETLHRDRKLGEADVHRYARERRFDETAVALSLLCGRDLDMTERALLDPGHEILLILGRLAGLSSTTVKAMLLLKAAERGMSAQNLDQALMSYGRLQPETAHRVLGFHLTRGKGPAVNTALAANG